MGMNVDTWYQSRKGQSLLVPGADPADRGQCMQAWDFGLNEIYGLPYVWANAIDCWNNFDRIPQLRNNFDRITDGSIKKGDGVVFNEKVGSVYGHIDWAMSDGSTQNFTGADSNWGGNKTLHLVNHTGSQYVLGALRLKGGVQPPKGDKMQRGTVELLYQVFGVPYGKNDLDYFTGSSVDDFAILLNNNPAHKAQVDKLNNADKGFVQITDPVYKKG